MSAAAQSTDPLAGLAHERVTVDPPSPYRLPRAVPDGVLRRSGGVLERVAAHDGELVLLRAAQPRRGGPVVMGAWAGEAQTAGEALERWRRTLCVDVDHSAFLQAAWRDPYLGPLVRRDPGMRPAVRYRPHEALLWAVSEQLIEYVDAARIQRGLVRLAGRRCERTGLRDAPAPAAILALAPAQIEALGLAPRRVLLLRRVCTLLGRGLSLEGQTPGQRVDALRRLRAMPGIGSWTIACLALRGQGDPDASPSGDLGLLKTIGRLIAGPATQRDRRHRLPLATEEQVNEFLEPFSPWRGYAAEHLLAAG